VDGGALTRVSPGSAASEDSITFTLPAVQSGYYVLSLQTHGTSGGQLLLVDGTEPTAPRVIQPFQAQRIYSTSRPDIAGTAEPGSRVQVWLDEAEEAAEVSVDATGAWSYTPPESLEPGSHTLSVTATDRAGNLSGPSSVTFFLDLPVSHYGWGCASTQALPFSGIWLVVTLWLGRRGGRRPTSPPGH